MNEIKRWIDKVPAKGTVISFSGAQGTGKTTAAIAYAKRFEKENPGKSAGVIVDVERRCPFPINRGATRRAQEWIFLEQLRQQRQFLGYYDIVVSDRTLLDVVAYSMAAGFTDQVKPMLEVWRRHNGCYEKIIFRHIETNCWNVEDGCRDTDPVFRSQVEATLYELYRHEQMTSQSRFIEV